MVRRTQIEWAEIRRQVEIFQTTEAHEAIIEEINKKLEETYATLGDRKSSESDLRFAQGAISGLKYGIIVFKELLDQARRSSERS
jgi:hypothetical protein